MFYGGLKQLKFVKDVYKQQSTLVTLVTVTVLRKAKVIMLMDAVSPIQICSGDRHEKETQNAQIEGSQLIIDPKE